MTNRREMIKDLMGIALLASTKKPFEPYPQGFSGFPYNLRERVKLFYQDEKYLRQFSCAIRMGIDPNNMHWVKGPKLKELEVSQNKISWVFDQLVMLKETYAESMMLVDPNGNMVKTINFDFSHYLQKKDSLILTYTLKIEEI